MVLMRENSCDFAASELPHGRNSFHGRAISGTDRLLTERICKYRQGVILVINFKFYLFIYFIYFILLAIAIRMVCYIYLFKMVQAAIKPIYVKKKVITTKVPFIMIHNI